MSEVKTIRKHWVDYRNKVYPVPPTQIQEQECERAFNAGFFQAMLHLTELSVNHTEDEAVVFLEKLHQENGRFRQTTFSTT